MKKIILFIICVFLSHIAVQAQSEDLFSWANTQVVEKSKFITIENHETPSDQQIYVWGTQSVSSSNDKYTYKVQRIDLYPDEGVPSCQAVRIKYNNHTIFTKWAEGAFWNVSYLTKNVNDNRTFLTVPLDDDSFALIFGGLLYDTETDAGEMLIVVVSRGKATVVYDSHAIAINYTPVPNFSLEFTETLGNCEDSNGKWIDFLPDLRPTTWKHKIWKEGNVLKYKKWK